MANRPVRTSRASRSIILLTDSESDGVGDRAKEAKRGTKRKVEHDRAKQADGDWADADAAEPSEGDASLSMEEHNLLPENEEERSKSSKRQAGGSARKTSKVNVPVSSSREAETAWRRHAEQYHNVPTSLLRGGEGQSKLLEWFEGVRERRAMPWRKRYNPEATIEEKGQRAYEVWVSEVMLQQTQVKTVIPFWKAWLERWPTITSLASATTEEVASAWRGLGYYRRARSLLAGAQRIAADPARYHGRLPENPARLEKEIEGVGRYTAGAICSIAYGVTAPIIDGNIHRLLCRVLAMHALPTSPPLLKKLWAAAEQIVNALDSEEHPGVAGDWNQALMELGSQICKPVAPNCKGCPLQSSCKAYAELKVPPPTPEMFEPRETATDPSRHPPSSGSHARIRGTQSAAAPPECAVCVPPLCDDLEPSLNGGITSVTIFPMKKAPKESREEMTAVRVMKWESPEGMEKWLMVKRPNKGLLAGLWEPPSVVIQPYSPVADAEAVTEDLALQILTPADDLAWSAPKMHGSFLHVFSHIDMTYLVLSSLVSVSGQGPPAISPDFAEQMTWMTADEIKHANIGTGFKKLWTLVYGPELFGGAPAKKGRATAKKAGAQAPLENGKVVKKLAMPMMPGGKVGK